MLAIHDPASILEDQFIVPALGSDDRESIATENAEQEHPEWNNCIDSLLKIWPYQAESTDLSPDRTAVEAAIRCLAYWRKRIPSLPPTLIVPEPDGGVIVEWRTTTAAGESRIYEFTFYNDGTSEFTEYRNGRIEQMFPIRVPPVVQ